MEVKVLGKRAIIGGVAVSLVLSGTGAAAAAAATPSSSGMPGITKSAVALADKAGFAASNGRAFSPTSAVTTVPLTPTLAVKLSPTSGKAFTNGSITVNSKAANGTTTVAKVGGFGVVTNRHANLEYRYKTLSPAGTTLVKAVGGGLDEKNGAGQTVGHIDAAYAIDSTGTEFPASYSYDSAKHEIVVKANTTKAKGDVFIDPSWGCYAKLAGYGLLWLTAAAGWLFGWSFPGVDWALVTWFRIAPSVANSIAMSCHG